MSIDGGPQVAALWLQSSQTDGVSHQHGDARRTHFRHDLHSIAFDRSGADLEYVADRRAGVPGDDKVEDLHLTRGQPVKPGAEILYRLLPLPQLEPPCESSVDGGDELAVVDRLFDKILGTGFDCRNRHGDV